MKLRWIVLLALFVLIAVGIFFRSEITGQVKSFRYRAAVEDAREALDDDKPEEVARLAGAAMRLSSGAVGEVRELFDLASSVRSSDCLALGEILFEHPEAGAQDRIAVLEFVSEVGEPFFLESLLGRLAENELGEPRVVALRATQMLRKGDRLGALLLLDSLPEEDLELISLRILKGRLMAGEPGNPLAWQASRKLLGEIMAGEGRAEAMAAFRALVLLPDQALRKWNEPDLRAWLDKQEGVEPRDHLAAAHWQLLRQPETEDQVMVDVLALVDQAPEEVARWVLDHRQDSLILEREIDLDSADSYPFYLARLQHFINQKSWKEAQSLLERPHRSMKASLHSGFQAAVANCLGDEITHLTSLQEALEKAKHSEAFGEFLSLVEIGERLGDQAMKRKACEQLVALPARFLPGGNRLTFLEFEFGSEPEFLASLYQKLYAAKPDDPAVTYRKALIDHVISGKSEEALKALNYLLNDYPKAASLRLAKALVIADDSLKEAFALLQNEDGQLIPLEGAVEMAIYQHLLRRRNDEEQARRYLRRIDWSALPPYLRDFLKPKVASSVSEP